ncbi:MAG: arylsulfatase [Verrucomicrobiota bacterium]|jgi:arylsulfatase A-like enzyme
MKLKVTSHWPFWAGIVCLLAAWAHWPPRVFAQDKPPEEPVKEGIVIKSRGPTIVPTNAPPVTAPPVSGLPMVRPLPRFMPEKPNILFILADDLGYGDLGSYGQKKIQTPNLDRLALEGMRFTQAYAGSTVCAPSRCALLTGKHTGHCRIRGNAKVPLELEDITIAEVLKSAGYRTAAIGKWGLGLENSSGHPRKQGFDEWLGYLDQTHAHDYYPTNLWRNENSWTVRHNLNQQQGQYSHDLFTRAAQNFIRINRNNPFFLYLAYTIPHANNELKEKGMQVPSDEPYSKENWPQPEKNKAAMITRLDRDVGVLLNQITEYGLDRQTIIFFTSDNGPHKEGGVDPKILESSGPLRGIKRDLYEGGIRVPMIVRWTGRIKPGVVSDFPWAFWDVLPTCAEIAGVKPPKEIDGISVLPTLLGKPQAPHEFFYWEFHEKGFKQAVRMGDWKAVRLAQDQPLELYHLKHDPAEKENVADKNPEVIAKVEEYLKAARTENPHWPPKPKPNQQSRKSEAEKTAQ